MKKKVRSLLLFALFIIVLFMGFLMSFNGTLEAFDQVTAQEAFNMVCNGEATLLDVRTLEECTFLGSPALYAGGEPIAFLISWKLFGSIDDNGQIVYKDNPDFDSLIEQTFGSSKDHALIVMCGFGGRSTGAANRLEQMGFTSVYEIDNKLKELASPPGGCGGFQGSNYQAETNGYYLGYRGYPGRLPNASVPSTIKVATITAWIENENDSVSWMDTGLPITQKLDPKRIPKLKEAEPPSSDNQYPPSSDIEDSFSGTQSASPSPDSVFSSPSGGYKAMPYFQQSAYSLPSTGCSSTIPQPNPVLPDQSFLQNFYMGSSLFYSWPSQFMSSTGFTSANSVYIPQSS